MMIRCQMSKLLSPGKIRQTKSDVSGVSSMAFCCPVWVTRTRRAFCMGLSDYGKVSQVQDWKA